MPVKDFILRSRVAMNPTPTTLRGHLALALRALAYRLDGLPTFGLLIEADEPPLSRDQRAECLQQIVPAVARAVRFEQIEVLKDCAMREFWPTLFTDEGDKAP